MQKKIGISRQTVKKYCEGATTPEVRKNYKRTNHIITDDVKTFILECFQTDEQEHVKKQSHTAKRIYDRLIHEKGYTGSYSSICKVVRELKPNLEPTQADIPLAYDQGDAIQIDWGEVTLYLDGVKTKANIFCGRLCYSCAIYVQVFQSQNLESFLEAQQRMFDFFDGVPDRLIFDNAKVAVKDGFGLHAKATDGYKVFAAHYAFQTDFCNAAKGNEKGLVENLVGYARKNFFVPLPRVVTLNELNAALKLLFTN